MTRTESIGRRFGGSFIVVVVFAIACAFAIITISLDYADWTTRAMSAIYNDSANRKAHERMHVKITKVTQPVVSVQPQENGASVVLRDETRGRDAGRSRARLRNAPEQNPKLDTPKRAADVLREAAAMRGRTEVPNVSVIPLRPIQEDAACALPHPATVSTASKRSTTSGAVSVVPVGVLMNAVIYAEGAALTSRRRSVEHPSNPTPRDLSGLPMYRLVSDGASWYQMVPDGTAETEDIITTVTFRRNDQRNKIDLTHPISICVEYPDAADHARSCGSANWMAPDTNDLTIDVVMPRRNTSGEPYARFGRNITCNVTYYDEREGAHMVMTTEQWSGGDCGAVAMIVVGGQP